MILAHLQNRVAKFHIAHRIVANKSEMKLRRERVNKIEDKFSAPARECKIRKDSMKMLEGGGMKVSRVRREDLHHIPASVED